MLKLLTIGLTLVSSVRAFVLPFCNFDHYGRYICHPLLPQPTYYDRLKQNNLEFQSYVTRDVNNYYDWAQNILKNQIDYQNQFPWLANDPYIQHNQLQRKNILDYNQEFMSGAIEHNFKAQNSFINHDAEISKNQHDVTTG